MKNYRSRVGDRWLDKDDGEIVEVTNIRSNGWVEICVIKAGVERADEIVLDPNEWDNTEYLGNFSKSGSFKNLFDKLNG